MQVASSSTLFGCSNGLEHLVQEGQGLLSLEGSIALVPADTAAPLPKSRVLCSGDMLSRQRVDASATADRWPTGAHSAGV